MTTHTDTGNAGLSPQMPRRIVQAAVPLLILLLLLVLAVLAAPVVVTTLTTVDPGATVVPHPSPGPDPATGFLGRG